jgi:hypothetical protein
MQHYRQTGRPQVVQITREIAQRHAAMPMLGMDRKLSDVRVGAYIKMIELGAMRPVPWAVAKCIETGETYRVNGQHTSNAYMAVDQIPTGSYAIMEHYVCDTIEDVAHLWQTYDSSLGMRNNREIMQAFAATSDKLVGISTNVLMLCAGAIRVANDDGFVKNAHRRDTMAQRAEELLNNGDFAQWLDDRFSRKTHAHIMRSGVVASMFMTWKRCHRDAEIYWTEIRDESNPDNQSASRRAAKWLTQMHTRKKSNPGVVREQYVRCLLWWNAFRKNTPTDFRYKAADKTPAVA